ncbi:MAG: glycosyltransferase [Clostridia bacterium]|nr:glycosyltransferase [Clostridia bacterium]
MDNTNLTLQVLIAAMNENDFSLVKNMNIHCDCIMANQTDNSSKGDFDIGGNSIKVINSTFVGLGANRNLALDNASADIVLFADDDLVYADDMPEGVLSAFETNPRADVILFSCTETDSEGQVVYNYAPGQGRRYMFNSLKFPTYVIAARTKSLKRKKIRFSAMFGAGSSYSFGEDTVFLADCFKAGLKVYGSDFNIGTSTKELHWFEGYTDSFFITKGAVYKCIFGKSAPVYGLHFAKKYAKMSGIDKKLIYELMEKGMEDYQKKIKTNNLHSTGL